MATQDDVRRIALSLPETSEATDRFAFTVADKRKQKAFAWVWLERLEPKKPRAPQPAVLAVRVENDEAKQFLIGAVPGTFFTEPPTTASPRCW